MVQAVCLGAPVEPGLKSQGERAALFEQNPPAVSVFFVERASEFLLAAKLQTSQFLVGRYSADLEGYQAVSSGDATTIDVLAGDRDGHVDWEIVYFRQVLLTSLAIIFVDWSVLKKACLVVSQSAPV